jgi:hypothetical protein
MTIQPPSTFHLTPLYQNPLKKRSTNQPAPTASKYEIDSQRFQLQSQLAKLDTAKITLLSQEERKILQTAVQAINNKLSLCPYAIEDLKTNITRIASTLDTKSVGRWTAFVNKFNAIRVVFCRCTGSYIQSHTLAQAIQSATADKQFMRNEELIAQLEQAANTAAGLGYDYSACVEYNKTLANMQQLKHPDFSNMPLLSFDNPSLTTEQKIRLLATALCRVPARDYFQEQSNIQKALHDPSLQDAILASLQSAERLTEKYHCLGEKNSRRDIDDHTPVESDAEKQRCVFEITSLLQLANTFPNLILKQTQDTLRDKLTELKNRGNIDSQPANRSQPTLKNTQPEEIAKQLAQRLQEINTTLNQHAIENKTINTVDFHEQLHILQEHRIQYCSKDRAFARACSGTWLGIKTFNATLLSLQKLRRQWDEGQIIDAEKELATITGLYAPVSAFSEELEALKAWNRDGISKKIHMIQKTLETAIYPNWNKGKPVFTDSIYNEVQRLKKYLENSSLRGERIVKLKAWCANILQDLDDMGGKQQAGSALSTLETPSSVSSFDENSVYL